MSNITTFTSGHPRRGAPARAVTQQSNVEKTSMRVKCHQVCFVHNIYDCLLRNTTKFSNAKKEFRCKHGSCRTKLPSLRGQDRVGPTNRTLLSSECEKKPHIPSSSIYPTGCF